QPNGYIASLTPTSGIYESKPLFSVEVADGTAFYTQDGSLPVVGLSNTGELTAINGVEWTGPTEVDLSQSAIVRVIVVVDFDPIAHRVSWARIIRYEFRYYDRQ
ncbi:hypothetical protein ACFL2H_13145, partial [Planctomycetota bacterium]